MTIWVNLMKTCPVTFHHKIKRKNRINSVHNVANLKMFLYCDICYIYINILKELNFFFFFNDNLLWKY